MKQIKFLLPLILCVLTLPSILIYCKKGSVADLVAFSYNRPIQLYALLESIECYVTGLNQVHVIYRSTDQDYETAYQEVKKSFPSVIFHKQGIHPRKDFKPLTLKATFESPSKYILFAVDDIIVKDFIDIKKSIKLLEKTKAYGFYFRLGQNLNWCYTLNKPQANPKFIHIQNDVYAWHIKSGQHDWGYPNTVDMTLYRKKDVELDLRAMNYYAPNPLEGQWSGRAYKIRRENKMGLCYNTTKIVNLPLNRVQDVYKNRHMGTLDTKELLDIFNQGEKIDIASLFKIQNKSAHMDYEPTFIKRVCV